MRDGETESQTTARVEEGKGGRTSSESTPDPRPRNQTGGFPESFQEALLVKSGQFRRPVWSTCEPFAVGGFRYLGRVGTVYA